ncbi:hypothetical protein N1851_006728 [Merluccius polli]|uniref:Uncharacterized protein n=1 Tax=Merluccius polli TaxID=89951 RepID=A0AA47N5C3_MERPO|nr:hypothetical protein N1851_006728 [Merluccius polli]
MHQQQLEQASAAAGASSSSSWSKQQQQLEQAVATAGASSCSWSQQQQGGILRSSISGLARFSSEGIRYLVVLVGPYEGNATKRSRAQCVCVSLRFVATGTYLHTVGDAEHISKKVPCDTQGCSCPKYTAKYVCGVSQLFANTNCQVASYQLAGKRKHLYT